MPNRKLSIGSTLVSIMFAVAVLVTGTAVAQREKVLHSFNDNGTPYGGPNAGLTSDSSGNLYGTTRLGGIYNLGMVFELMPKAGGGWAQKVLHNFGNGYDGSSPESRLIFDAAGNLYGTTYQGGASHSGTVFELLPGAGGGWTETILSSFGGGPYGDLIFDAAGNLYGTITAGAYNVGSIFKLSPSASGWTVQILHTFNNNGTDGYGPTGTLTIDAAGNLYGTTRLGGTNCSGNGNCGTVFKLTLQRDGRWREQILHNFSNNGTDGYDPGGLILGAHGNLYGTTFSGGSGSCGCGTVFELTRMSGGQWTERILYDFNSVDAGGPAGLILHAPGKLYGTEGGGGNFSCTSDCGAVFELSLTAGGWTEKVLHSFTGSDGNGPLGNPIFDAAGNLYGTTEFGGAYNDGTVFEITP